MAGKLIFDLGAPLPGAFQTVRGSAKYRIYSPIRLKAHLSSYTVATHHLSLSQVVVPCTIRLAMIAIQDSQDCTSQKTCDTFCELRINKNEFAR